MLISTKANH